MGGAELQSRPYLTVKKVFISSRMEELATERKSAYETIVKMGLVPLMFEATPASKDDLAKIDRLIDASDLFLGVYSQTLGPKLPGKDLAPIEYELYRFLVMHEFKDQLRSGACKESDKHRIVDGVLDGAGGVVGVIGRIRNEIRLSQRGYENKIGRHSQIFSTRVRLFHHVHATQPDGGMLTHGLAAFLKPFRCIPFSSCPAADNMGSGATSFLPRHVALQKAIDNHMREGMKARSAPALVSPPQLRIAPDPSWEVKVAMRVPDFPGHLLWALDVLFDLNLNIRALSTAPATKDGGNQGARETKVVFWCADFDCAEGQSRPPDGLRYETLIRRALADGQHSRLESVEIVNAGAGDVSLKRRSPVGAGSSSVTHELYVETLNAPGILRSIASRLLSLQVNVVSIRQSHAQGRVRDVQVARILIDARKLGSRVDDLEVELPAIAGVVGARINCFKQSGRDDGLGCEQDVGSGA